MVTLGPDSFSFALRYLVGFTGSVSWPTVSIVIPPVAVLVVLAGLVSVRILLLAVPVNLPDLLVYVVRVGFEAFTACPVFAFAVQL